MPYAVHVVPIGYGLIFAVGAGAYLFQGYIDPGLSMPVMLRVLIGLLAGARVLVKAKPR